MNRSRRITERTRWLAVYSPTSVQRRGRRTDVAAIRMAWSIRHENLVPPGFADAGHPRRRGEVTTSPCGTIVAALAVTTRAKGATVPPQVNPTRPSAISNTPPNSGRQQKRQPDKIRPDAVSADPHSTNHCLASAPRSHPQCWPEPRSSPPASITSRWTTRCRRALLAPGCATPNALSPHRQPRKRRMPRRLRDHDGWTPT
jgi:hypothetical protein